MGISSLFFKKIYLLIFGCIGVSSAARTFSSRGEQRLPVAVCGPLIPVVEHRSCSMSAQ